MREKINRLAKGIVDMDQLKILASPRSVEKTVPENGSAAGELFIADENGGFVKGLAYSSHLRVRLLNEAFGGTRCRVSYEVDGRFLPPGQEIAGNFHLVTNGGEFDIPFVFTVISGKSGELLNSLKTPQDFARVARQNPETALRLLTFRDFTEAPFMQDGRVRALYDGLKDRQDRRNSLEEFLVGMGVKEPVELLVDTASRRYRAPEMLSRDVLEVKLSSWGYFRFEAAADSVFLQPEKTVFEPQEAEDGVCRVVYHIDPSKLHGGKNLGAVRIRTARTDICVPVEVQAAGRKARPLEESFPEDLARYLMLRLAFGETKTESVRPTAKLRPAVDRLRETYGETLAVVLVDAELCLLEKKPERAVKLLEEHRGEMAENRQGKYVEYCFYIWLQMQLTGREEQRETLIRLVRRHMEEDEPSGLLFWLWTRLQPELPEEAPELFAEQLEHYFARGCRSPFLYACALRLYAEHPERLRRIGNLELQMLCFALKKTAPDRALLERAAALISGFRRFHKLACRLLIRMYGTFPEKQFLSAVCGMFIKGNLTGPEYFSWYEKAVQQGVSLTGLYEYYLFTLPKDYPYLLPKEVLLYFSYGKDLDSRSRALLYTNIVKYMKKDDPLYRQYEREIGRFTMDQLFKTRVDRRLVVLYRSMIYPDMIDRRVAAVLPSVLKSYRIRVKNPNMKYVIVRYEELEEEDAWPVRDGIAYVPLILDGAVMLFQDQYGNRYFNMPHAKTPAMEETDVSGLLARCFEVFPEHPLLRLRRCGEVLENGISDDAEATELQKLMEDLPLHPLCRRRLVSALIAWHTAQLKSPGGGRTSDVSYLLGLEAERLSQEERAGICEALTAQKHTAEAWDLVCGYGSEGVSTGTLKEICSAQLLRQNPKEPERLLAVSGLLFEQGVFDGVTLDCLCEHYNGAGETMYRLLKQSRSDHVETYDLAERLLAQLMFTGDSRRLDEVFDWYTAGRQKGESLVKAYFTIKSAEYFLMEQPVRDRVFAYLEGALRKAQDLRRVPTLYLLALGRYYAGLAQLDEERREICTRLVDQLLSEHRVFPWFHALGRNMRMPESLMDKTLYEYRSGHKNGDAGKPQLKIRILPEEQEFHPEELKKVYPGIYVFGKALFAGETMEYLITELCGDEEKTAAEGRLSPDPDLPVWPGSRYAKLNELCRIRNEKDESVLKEKMTEYLTGDAVVEELFPSV